MYTLVRRFIKMGIVFLFSGLLLGAWILVRRDIFGIWPHPHLVSAHAHAVLVGFVMFFILGVARCVTDRRYRSLAGRPAAGRRDTTDRVEFAESSLTP